MSEEQKHIRATVGAFIENKEGKIFLIRSPKWKNVWLCPSGGIEYGESPLEACIREAKEETGLDLVEPEFIQFVSMVEPVEYHKPMHFIGFDYKFKLADENQKPIVDKKEVLEYSWFDPDEIVSRDDIEFTTKESIKKMLQMREQRSFEEYKAGWQRAQADYQNLKKEIENMRGEWARYSEQQILEEFIPVYDHLQLAINNEQLAKNNDPWLEGVRFVGKQFEKILKDHNVEKIKTVGEMFNPELHEAVSQEESDLPEHIIIREVEAGYTMKGKVIKVAKVIVSK